MKLFAVSLCLILLPGSILAQNDRSQSKTTGSAQRIATSAPAPPMPPTAPPAKEEVMVYVQEGAEFPGGILAMRAFIKENLHYPETVVKQQLQGKIFLRFIVRKDGSIATVTILRGTTGCPECDQEAIRVVNSMPKWTPAKNEGKAVDSYYTLPITFEPTNVK